MVGRVALPVDLVVSMSVILVGFGIPLRKSNK